MVDRSDRIGRGDESSPGARLREFFESLSDEAADFTRRKPVEGLLLAFLSGIVLGELLRRNR